MSKCCYGMITFSHYLASLKLGWGLDSFFRLHSCDINTFGPLTVVGSSTCFLTNLSISKLGRIILNVNDGICYLFFGNYVLRESTKRNVGC